LRIFLMVLEKSVKERFVRMSILVALIAPRMSSNWRADVSSASRHGRKRWRWQHSREDGRRRWRSTLRVSYYGTESSCCVSESCFMSALCNIDRRPTLQYIRGSSVNLLPKGKRSQEASSVTSVIRFES